MQEDGYNHLSDNDDNYWWIVGRKKILQSVLQKHLSGNNNKVLDIGCGPGGNITFLKNFGDVYGIDDSSYAINLASNKPYKELKLIGGEQIPFEDGSFDLVTLLDVLEHIENDEKAVNEAWRVLKPEGFLLVTVPAYSWLWTKRDVLLKHKRRYTEKELSDKLKIFSIKKQTYFSIPSVAFLLAYKLISSKDSETKLVDSTMPVFLNRFLTVWLKTEQRIINFARIPFGTSCLILAQKKLQ